MITYKISRLPPPIRPVHIFNPMYIRRKKRYTTVNSIPIDWELQSRVIGEGITIFTSYIIISIFLTFTIKFVNDHYFLFVI
jgi:hypothetical protein